MNISNEAEQALKQMKRIADAYKIAEFWDYVPEESESLEVSEETGFSEDYAKSLLSEFFGSCCSKLADKLKSQVLITHSLVFKNQ